MESTASPRTESRRRPVVAGARLTVAESEQLRAVADEHGVSVSNYLRGLVLGAIGATAVGPRL